MIEGRNILLRKAKGYSTDNINQNDKYRISGVVKDLSGEPIIGANVSIKGTTIGAITDLNGKFNFIAPYNGVLQVSYIGYEKQEIRISNKRDFIINLKEDTKMLDEVVVVGYGTQR